MIAGWGRPSKRWCTSNNSWNGNFCCELRSYVPRPPPGIFHLAHNSQHCSLGCFYGQEQRLGAFLLLHLVKLSAVSGQNYESVSGQSEYHLRLILGLPHGRINFVWAQAEVWALPFIKFQSQFLNRSVPTQLYLCKDLFYSLANF